MAHKVDVSQYESFDQITSRLDDIVSVVRESDTSLEHSLDLFEEAIALGSRAVDMVDATALSEEEKARLAGQEYVSPEDEGAVEVQDEASSLDEG